MEGAVFAVAVADLNLNFLIVGQEADRLNAQAHVFGFLLLEALVRDDVKPCFERLRGRAVALKEHAAVKHRLAVLISEKRADALFGQFAEQGGHGVGGNAVGTEGLFAHDVEAVGNSLVLEQCFEGNGTVSLFDRRHLFELEHIVLASNDHRRFEADITHPADKSQL